MTDLNNEYFKTRKKHFEIRKKARRRKKSFTNKFVKLAFLILLLVFYYLFKSHLNVKILKNKSQDIEVNK